LTLTETGPETCIFRIIFSDPTPETLEANIYLPVSPTAEVADSLQYYYGEREPLPDDPILTESEDDPSSLIFTGTFADVESCVAIDCTTFIGLTDEPDTFSANVSFWLDEVTTMVVRTTFAETAGESKLFVATLEAPENRSDEDEGQVEWTAAVDPGERSDIGSWHPFATRVRSVPYDPDLIVNIGEAEFELDHADPEGYLYTLSASKVIAGVFQVGNQRYIVYYDLKTQEVEKKTQSPDAAMELKTKAGKKEVFIVSSRLESIKGCRAYVLNDFSQQKDPHKPGRLFIDTTEAWDGKRLNPNQYDKQRVKITVTLSLPPDTTYAQLDNVYRVRWLVFDPDDPCQSKDIDKNGAVGGDNTGNPHEGAGHWFMPAGHEIVWRGQVDIDEQKNEKKKYVLLEHAETKISRVNNQYVSTVYFYFSDDGGDNYRIKVLLTVPTRKGRQAVCSDRSGELVVWRKRWVTVYAMARSDDVQCVLPGATTTSENTPVVTAGPNGKLNTTAKGDDIVDQEGKHILAGPNKKCDTDVGHYYPEYHTIFERLTLEQRLARFSAHVNYAFAGLAVLGKTLAISPIGPSRVRSTFIDVVCVNAQGAPARTLYCSYRQELKGVEMSKYALVHTNYHDRAGRPALDHPDATYQVIGVSSVAGSIRGCSVYDPHAFIDMQDLGLLGSTLVQVINHELGHMLFPENVDIHYHDPRSTWRVRCVGSVKFGEVPKDNYWCPLHRRILRENCTRSWPRHDVSDPNPNEETRDSDKQADKQGG